MCTKKQKRKKEKRRKKKKEEKKAAVIDLYFKLILCQLTFNSVQDGIYAFGKPICAPHHLSELSPKLRLKQFKCFKEDHLVLSVITLTFSASISHPIYCVRCTDKVCFLSFCVML